MKLGYRLSVMILSVGIIVAIGWWGTNSLNFLVSQFWFVAGALLLVLLSLVDQPHFSKDANVFVNGAAAWVSLFAVPESQRSSLWIVDGIWIDVSQQYDHVVDPTHTSKGQVFRYNICEYRIFLWDQ